MHKSKPECLHKKHRYQNAEIEVMCNIKMPQIRSKKCHKKSKKYRNRIFVYLKQSKNAQIKNAQI